jgi:3alpha(or 20beta)-hydroxysteroid dehydrogenase
MALTGGRLAGKVAVITGAAKGQGEAEARLFVAEGASVVLTDVLDERGQIVAKDLGDAARFLRHDISSEEDWAAVMATALETFGRVDVLVNNAAIHWLRTIEDETVADFRRMVDTNLVGTFLGIRSAIAPMRSSGGGSIVNISSAAGLVGYALHGTYGATKWGIRGLTRTAAIELGPDGIRVNSVHPGPIKTDMLPDDRAGLGDRRWKSIPLRRAGDPSEVAELVLFLASDASSFTSGGEFTVDGGSLAGPPTPAATTSAMTTGD